MSIHRSLKSLDTLKRHRSVLSRLERIQILQEKGSLDLEEGSSALGLPKVKHLKMRIRKEKAAATAEGGAAEGTAAAPAPGAAAPAKAAPAKAAPAKAAAAPAAKPKK